MTPFKKLLVTLIFLFITVLSSAQWLEWKDVTPTNLNLITVANSDDEEKDMEPADLNNDGWTDVIVVRKEPFSASTEPPKSDLLLMNTGGALEDQTNQYAPGFINTPTHARDVYIGDMDGDGWKDVIIANTFEQLPLYYANLGNDENGNWLGLENQSATRFPASLDAVPLICAVKAGDINGDGFEDLYFVNYALNEVALDFLFINDGNGNFTDEAQTRLGELRNSAFGTEVELKDVDNDGDKDIIKISTLFDVPPWNQNGVLILFNIGGNGTFNNWQNVSAPVRDDPYMMEIEDFNQDGLLDFYIIDDAQDYMLYANEIDADNSISYIPVDINSPNVAGFGGNLHASDLDVDGDFDIMVADVDVDIPPCDSERRCAILRNDNNSFNDPYGNGNFDWATNAYDFCLFDLNNDGLQDIILGKCSGYSLYLSHNCDLVITESDLDADGIADACDACPTNPAPNCIDAPDYPVVNTDLSIPRQWNELTLESIRRDYARPTVHARNLFHTSIAMWDAFAIYNQTACTYLLGQTLDGFTCDFDGFSVEGDIQEALEETISFAVYRILRYRFSNSPNATNLLAGYDNHMQLLGYNSNNLSTDYSTGDPAALGNYIAVCIINFGLQDNANEQNEYGNTSYQPVNEALIIDNPGNPTITDLNRWQPLTLEIFIDQSGNEIEGSTPDFLSPEWGQVTAFGLEATNRTVYQRNDFEYWVYHDQGAPPLLESQSDAYKWGFETVITWSSHLDPTDGVMWDISPANRGNTTEWPQDFADFPQFYNQLEGGTANTGHSTNPVTGQAYAPNMVARGDYARVLAEFWADGPESETPPGHWFTILNYVADHPDFIRQFQGEGTVLDELEWYVKAYFTMGGAMHDAAIAAWGHKGWYDYLRPVSAIRAMADLGQSSDPNLPAYHPSGLPLIEGYVELITIGDNLAGTNNENLNKIKVRAWKGHDGINNVDTDAAGVGWILAENWVPYQRSSFVTPPFAGYVSGHSTYSAAAAEVLSLFTGNPYFPGGIGTFLAPANEFLVFENGPSIDVELQWATYRDAANESALSRIWGGIHPPADDIPGRRIGVKVGVDAFNKAMTYFQDSNENGAADLCEIIDPCVETPDDSDEDGLCDLVDPCPDDPFNFCNPIAPCASNAANSGFEFIERVSIGTINNTSGNNGGYQDFTQLSTDLNIGENYTITLVPGFEGSVFDEFWTVWMDINADGDFEDTGETLFTGSGPEMLTGQIFIPTNLIPGPRFMRVSMQFDGAPSACGEYEFGEVEDYTVNIQAPCGLGNPCEPEFCPQIAFYGGLIKPTICSDNKIDIIGYLPPVYEGEELELVWLKYPGGDCITGNADLASLNVGAFYTDFLAEGGFGIASPKMLNTAWHFVQDNDDNDFNFTVENTSEPHCYIRLARVPGCTQFLGKTNMVSITGDDCETPESDIFSLTNEEAGGKRGHSKVALLKTPNQPLYDLMVYPNPAKEEMFFKSSQFVGNKLEMIILNNLGQKMVHKEFGHFTEDLIRQNLNQFTSGLYHARFIINDKENLLIKFVVNRM